MSRVESSDLQQMRLERAHREANRTEERNAERQLQRIAEKLPEAKAYCDAQKRRADQTSGVCWEELGCRGCPGYPRAKASGTTGLPRRGQRRSKGIGRPHGGLGLGMTLNSTAIPVPQRGAIRPKDR